MQIPQDKLLLELLQEKQSLNKLSIEKIDPINELAIPASSASLESGFVKKLILNLLSTLPCQQADQKFLADNQLLFFGLQVNLLDNFL